MIDKNTNEKIEQMEVYVSVMVDVSECKTASEAYRIAKIVEGHLMNTIEGSKKDSKINYTINDSYEVFRSKDGDIADDEDEC